MFLTKQQLHAFARRGAQATLDELRLQEAAIRAAFPELSAPAQRRALKKRVVTASKVARKTTKRWTVAMRRDVSRRMTAYWKGRQRAKKGAK